MGTCAAAKAPMSGPDYRDQGDQVPTPKPFGRGLRHSAIFDGAYWAGKDLLSTRQNNRHSFNLWQRTMPCNGNRQRVQMLQISAF